MQNRGWDVKETAVMAITANELDTARRRTSGSMEALKAAGFPENRSIRFQRNPMIFPAHSMPLTLCWFNTLK